MAHPDDENKEEETVPVPLSILTKMQEQMAEMERKIEEGELKNQGLQEMFDKGASAEGEPKLREKKNFEPKFRTVRIRKHPMFGTSELGYIIGWTDKGAYQEVDRSGVSPQLVDYINVIYLGHEKSESGAIKAEKIKLLDLFNHGIQVHCKIVDVKKENKVVPTGEEIDVTVFDPQHGLMATGDKVDGFVTYSDIEYTIQIPGVTGTTKIDGLFVN